MPASQTKIKTTEMQRFINTFGGMVADGEQPDETLTQIFEEFDSPQAMFEWIAERWVTGGFDKTSKAQTTTKAKKDPNKPKWCNAYMHFAKAERSTVKEQNPDMSNAEVTKELGRRWREEMSGADKEPYQNASDAEKAAYDEAMASYSPPTSDGETESPKKGRKKRDEGAPKKALNAYMHFTMAQRESVKADNAEMSNTEVTKELGRLWREEMDEEAKAPFIQAAAEDKQRYDREMKSYNPAESASNPKPAAKTPTKKPVKKPAAKPPAKEAAKAPAKTPNKKGAAKDAKKQQPKKKVTKKSKDAAQLEEAYAIFLEVEGEAAAQEREDGEEEPFTAEEMEAHLNELWEDLSPEDRLEYLAARE